MKDKTYIYISGPITGLERVDYIKTFSDAADRLSFIGHIPVNPAAVCTILPPEMEHEQYMEICMAMLKCCDSIYMLKGWEYSLGANREYGYALAAGMKILYDDGKGGCSFSKEDAGE